MLAKNIDTGRMLLLTDFAKSKWIERGFDGEVTAAMEMAKVIRGTTTGDQLFFHDEIYFVVENTGLVLTVVEKLQAMRPIEVRIGGLNSTVLVPREAWSVALADGVPERTPTTVPTLKNNNALDKIDPYDPKRSPAKCAEYQKYAGANSLLPLTIEELKPIARWSPVARHLMALRIKSEKARARANMENEKATLYREMLARIVPQELLDIVDAQAKFLSKQFRQDYQVMLDNTRTRTRIQSDS